ncbi:MAG: 23S rRNA (cytosine(1962)-C(5))-methyltransferase RlmI [Caldilineae bacterium]|nr:MAG: 23S rRNA (cytosine(1962)-C(5))-methyltransferase RlmI [Caldilineae bacterium]
MVKAQVILKKGREKSILNRHPWIFSGAIARVEGNPQNGDVVDVWNSKARFLARGVISLKSQIRVRILTWHPNERIDAAFWNRRIKRAIAGREALARDPFTNAYRLVHAEADGLPGLIVDRYGTWLVTQFLSVAAERHKGAIIDALAEYAEPQGIFERSDTYTRELEGLVPVSGPLWGEIPPDLIEIQENGFSFLVDVKGGQKTGFYLDQRENRQRLMPYLKGKEVLNAFSFTGAFCVYAAAAGAKRVLNIDTSEAARQLAEQNMWLNGFTDREDIFATADAFELMRAYRDQNWTFDVVILDPPKFARNARQKQDASRGYKDINLLGMKLLRPGGILATFSCSGVIPEDLFQKIVFGAAVDAHRDVQILERLHQGTDHPVLVTFPESAYLKGFICRVW